MYSSFQVGVVILNYNNLIDIKKCIESILRHVPLDIIKLVIVDNGSKIEIREKVHIYCSQLFNSYCRLNSGDTCNILTDLTYICVPENVGYACGNNVGIDFLCQFETITHIMVLNSDIILTEDIISPLLWQMSILPNVGAISPLLYKPSKEIDYCCARNNYPKNLLIYTFSYLFEKKFSRLNKQLKILLQDPSLLSQSSIEIELPSGSCMMFDKNTIKEIKGFDPNTFLYYEESILYKKLKLIGKQNYLIPSISCIHVGGRTTTSQKTAYFLKKCNYDSLLYYLKTYEDCSTMNLLYVTVTAKLRLFRLWIGKKYNECFRQHG